MNDDTDDPRALAYGLTKSDLKFEPMTLDQAPDLDTIELLDELLDPNFTKYCRYPARRLVLEAALALFVEVMKDPDYDEFSRTDLFGAALHTAFIWDRG